MVRMNLRSGKILNMLYINEPFNVMRLTEDIRFQFFNCSEAKITLPSIDLI